MKRRLILAAAVGVASFVAVWWLANTMAADGCLENGGRWNDRANACENPVPADRPRG